MDGPSDPADEALLSEDERCRAARFRVAADRHRFTRARAALRRILAPRLGLDPQQIRIGIRPGGKPEVEGPARGLRFNLSHSEGLAVVAAGPRELGVDLERIRELPDRDELVETVMTGSERAAFADLPAGRRTRAFFTAWTRKEAFLKATGDGLFRDPREVQAGVEARRSPAPIRSNRAVDGLWTVLTLAPPTGYAAALVVQGAPARIRIRRAHPPEFVHGRRTGDAHPTRISP